MAMQELPDGFCESMDPDEYEAVVEFFSGFFERKYKRKFEQGFERGIEQGRILGVCNIIFKNYRCWYDADFPEELKRKVSSINCYPALEEIQLTILKSALPVIFERQVDSIIEKYVDEINARNKKEK